MVRQAEKNSAVPSAGERLSMAQPIPYAALTAVMEHHKDLGRLSSRSLGQDGKWATWTEATLTSAVSDVQTGLIQAAMEVLPADERSPARARYHLHSGRFMHDIRTLLPRVPEMLRHHRATPDSRRISAQRAERLLRALVSGLTNRSPAAVRAAVLAPAWQGVIEAALAHSPRIAQSALNGLMHLATRADAAGLGPTDLPSEPREFAELLVELFPGRNRFFVRSAIRQLAALSISGVPAWTIPSSTYSSRRLHPDQLEHRRLAAERVPALAALVSEFARLRLSGVLKMRDDTAHKIEQALDRICAFAAKATEAGTIPRQVAASVNIWDWWTTLVHVFGPTGGVPSTSGMTTESSFMGEFEAAPENGGVPAIVAILAWAAQSGLMTKATSPGLPPSVRADANAAWSATQAVLHEKLRGRRATSATHAQVETARSRYNDGLVTLEQYESTSLTVKDKAAALRMASLPTVLGLMLPWWTLIELPRLARQVESLEKRIDRLADECPPEQRWGPDGHPVQRALHEQFATALEEWFALASAVADPVRIKNAWKGRVGTVGVEYTITASYTEDGDLVEVIRVESSFGGDEHAARLGNPAAALKTSAFGSRSWDWAAVAADPKWVRIYLQRVWHPRLIRHGLISSDTSIREALERGIFPLFVAERGRQRGIRKPAPLPGAYGSDSTIRRRFRMALLKALRAMGAHEIGLVNQPIPDTDKDAVRAWPWLLGPHIARLWWVSHLYGAMHKSGIQLRKRMSEGREQLIDPLTLARRATTDTETTMADEYDATEDYHRQISLRDPASWQHPLYFQGVVDFLCMPDTRPDLTALWEGWARAAREGHQALPPRLAEAWARRGAAADSRPPAVRRRRRGRGRAPVAVQE